MKEIVNKLVALSKEAQPLRESLHEHLKQIAIEYATFEAMRYGGPSILPTRVSSVDRWDINGDQVYVHWSEFWNYGGYEEGSFQFPVTYLYDTEQF